MQRKTAAEKVHWLTRLSRLCVHSHSHSHILTPGTEPGHTKEPRLTPDLMDRTAGSGQLRPSTFSHLLLLPTLLVLLGSAPRATASSWIFAPTLAMDITHTPPPPKYLVSLPFPHPAVLTFLYQARLLLKPGTCPKAGAVTCACVSLFPDDDWYFSDFLTHSLLVS